MRCILAALFAVTLLGVTARAADDLEAFQGTWRLVGGEIQGQEIPAGELPDGKVTFKNDRFNATIGDHSIEGTISVDADRDPKTFDADHEKGEDRGKKQYGIYKFEDEKLTICSAGPGSEESDRPTEFRTQPGENSMLFEFERDE
jgi:uncharacterized protein (TIGR03067 family)